VAGYNFDVVRVQQVGTCMVALFVADVAHIGDKERP